MAGPAGTGKSLACLHKVHLAMSKYPLAKAFISRKTRTSMTNSCLETFNRHVLKPPDKVHFHKTDQQYNYPNGSMIAVVGLDDPERIKSTDWDMGFVQEVTECHGERLGNLHDTTPKLDHAVSADDF
jgi:phage terminase large subunit